MKNTAHDVEQGAQRLTDDASLTRIRRNVDPPMVFEDIARTAFSSA